MKRRNKKKKLKKKVILGLIIILVLIVVILYFLFFKDKDSSKYLRIKLNGKNEVEINYQDDYEDKGAKAFYKDKDITKDIEIKNNLNLEKIGTYTYTYKIKYKKYRKEVERKINVVDKVSPEIILNGDSEVKVYQNDGYSEKGAKAVDNYDGDITDKIVINGDIDTTKIGEYTITYEVVDSSNNKSSVQRKVQVIEKPKVDNNKNDTSSGIVGKTSKGYTIEKKNGIYYINGILVANKSYPLPSSYNPGDLLKEFKDNFNKMKDDAKNDGVNLVIGSGFRSYNSQSSIYNNYVNRDGKEKADTYSARPGHSEHQSGLAADIYGEASKDKYLWQSWGETNDGKWVNNNCYKYGFIIRYVKGKENETGYMYESWHIRYVGVELSTKLYNNGDWITLESYLGIDSKY